MAGKIARDAGLANASGFCPINPENMRSATDANIYVVGDACIPGDMPKSGFSANSQAKVAAMMIRGELANGRTFPARYTNTCWSLIETDDTVKVGGSYAAKDGKIAATRRSSPRPAKPPSCASRRRRRTWAGMPASSPTFSPDPSAGMRTLPFTAGGLSQRISLAVRPSTQCVASSTRAALEHFGADV